MIVLFNKKEVFEKKVKKNQKKMENRQNRAKKSRYCLQNKRKQHKFLIYLKSKKM